MAELNDKLITYGNLTTFYDKLQEQGLGGNAIEEVSVLPNASENKDKLLRLDNGDKDVYAAKLLSSETITTNRLPDEQQIDKAYLYDTSDSDIHYYKGAYKLVCSDGEFNGYGWYYFNGGIFYLVITSNDAENITNTDFGYSLNNDDLSSAEIDEENRIITIPDITLSQLKDYGFYFENLNDFDFNPIPATYNAPESAQIGNAYLSDGDKYYYNGVEYTLNYTDGVSIKVYGWVYEDNIYPTIYTPKKASEIYYTTIDGNKITDAIGYIIDYEEYPVVSGVVTLDYPFSEQSNNMPDIQVMYIPQLNAPDSEQVGKAYVEDVEYAANYYYTGEKTLVTTDGSINIYFFKHEGETYPTTDNWFSVVSPSTIYSDNRSIWCYLSDLGAQIVDENTFSADVSTEEVMNSLYSLGDADKTLHTVKYQRTEVTEVWDWENIEFPEYTAGEGITIDSANTISCTVKPITDVSTLPDAESNKDSVLRLEGDKKLYVAKYNSQIAPDAQQVGVAYVTNDEGTRVYYTGTEVTIIAPNGTFTGYAWVYELQTISGIEFGQHISTTKAEEIIDDTALFYNNQEIHYVSGTTFEAVGILGTLTMRQAWDLVDGYYIKPVGYEWKRVVTEDAINITNETTFTGATLKVDWTQPSIVASGSTTIVWDDLASSIPSGKTVEVSVVLINTGNSTLTPTMQGNYQMMGDGNITIQPNELGLYRGRYISGLDKWLVEAINQEVSGTVL